MTVHGLPVREDEEYVTREELAAFLHVDITTVDRWRRRGMPSEKWGKRVRRFKKSKAVAWLREQEDQAA